MTTLPTVIVPVFNAFDALDGCLASLTQTLPKFANVLIADDASTDPRVIELIDRWVSSVPFNATYVRRNQNLGFPANCNAAFAEAGNNDVVLLNSDTITSSGWLQRLVECAASDLRIASITPWTNNGEIASFPRFIEPNPIPEDLSLIAASASRCTADYPDLPTAVGFCMYLRRDALNALGDFDAQTFGRGYGEENDWCRRAAVMGWRNVLCTRAFVAHIGNVSFSAVNMAPGGENLARLIARWPDYNELIARFIMTDPLRPYRDALSEQIRLSNDSGQQGDLFR